MRYIQRKKIYHSLATREVGIHENKKEVFGDYGTWSFKFYRIFLPLVALCLILFALGMLGVLCYYSEFGWWLVFILKD